MIQKVIKIGSSAGVTIPKRTMEELGIAIGDEVSIKISHVENKISSELIDWTDRFIKTYRKDLEKLAQE
ncbi:MAG: AbrB/MazE/SpoVT family DNA-binding domain-containing protein [Candidatus Taylorbacteria bacterium]|nr:AbrB/MazE/SpoVT family DNA-binding domain-containing protein [Candidatus Taylorbacteria bacterium]